MSPSTYQISKCCGTLHTTDDPIDSLEYHKLIAKGTYKSKNLPTFRPDR